MADLQEVQDQMGDWFIVKAAGGKNLGRGYEMMTEQKCGNTVNLFYWPHGHPWADYT